MKEINRKNGSDCVFSDELVFNDLDEGDKALVERVIAKGYTRRDTLKLMMATGVTMVAAQNLLSTGGVAMAQTPKKGGTVRAAMAIHGPDDQLDPTLFTSAIDYSRGRAHYNGLCQLDDDMNPQPELRNPLSLTVTPLNGRSNCAKTSASMMVHRLLPMMSSGV